MSNRTSKHRNSNISFSGNLEKISHKKYERQEDWSSRYKNKQNEQFFRCDNCSAMVTAERSFSGVNHRNHCPNCLWSKHVDLAKPGDRKAACHARMQPIGLTVKRTGMKYGGSNSGELMLIHRCTSCGKISINRIAADDSTGALIKLYQRSIQAADDEETHFAESGIHLLQAGDLTTVYSQLFGWKMIIDEFETNSVPVEIHSDIEEVTE